MKKHKNHAYKNTLIMMLLVAIRAKRIAKIHYWA